MNVRRPGSDPGDAALAPGGPVLPPVDLYLEGAVPVPPTAGVRWPEQLAISRDTSPVTPAATASKRPHRRRRPVMFAAAAVVAAGAAAAAVGLATTASRPVPFGVRQLAADVSGSMRSGSVSWVLTVKGRTSFGSLERGVDDLPDGPSTTTAGDGLRSSRIGGVLYAEVAPGRWNAVSLTALPLPILRLPGGTDLPVAAEGLGILLSYFSPLDASVTRLRQVAEEKVEGVATTEYSFVLGPPKSSPGGHTSLDLGVSPATVSVWVSGSGRVQGYTVAPLGPLSFEPLLTRWTAVRYGRPVSIRPPPSGQVVWVSLGGSRTYLVP